MGGAQSTLRADGRVRERGHRPLAPVGVAGMSKPGKPLWMNRDLMAMRVVSFCVNMGAAGCVVC